MEKYLNDIFLDNTCFSSILNNSSGYNKKINEAGNDAEDLRAKIHEMLLDNPTDKLVDFASSSVLRELNK